jgi:hypothetical protein
MQNRFFQSCGYFDGVYLFVGLKISFCWTKNAFCWTKSVRLSAFLKENPLKMSEFLKNKYFFNEKSPTQ